MEILKVVLIMLMIGTSVVSIGCGNGNFRFSTDDVQKESGDNDLVWRNVSMPRDGNMKLYMELPFEFDDCRKFEDLPEIKDLETYMHKNNDSLVMINHGVIISPNKKVKFVMDTFADLVGTVREKELVRSEKRSINGREVTYLACKGKAEKDNRECTMEYVGVQVGNDYWMISYYYYTDDNTMAEIAKRSIESIRIQ